MNLRRRHFAITERLESRRLLASVANVIADINKTTSMLDPGNYTSVGSVTFFTAKSAHGDGPELWKTDGTAAGTRRVRDINPGTAAANPANLTNLNGTLYFTADDGTSGTELWKSDGTEAGTTRVRDIRAGTASASPRWLTDVGGTLYFTATDATGETVWRTDGTEAGTVRASTVNYTFATNKPLAALGGTLLFSATDNTTSNASIFRITPGPTAANPVNVFTFSSSTRPSHLTAWNGKVYFNADQSTLARGDLWATDGTTTAIVKAITFAGSSSDSSAVSTLTPSGSFLYFIANDVPSGRYELWRTDGSNGGTIPLTNPTTTTGLSRYTQLSPVGTSSVLFSATRAGTGVPATGEELFRSDGTAATTGLLKDVLPGAAGGLEQGGLFHLSTSQTYFGAVKADGYTELWKTDGTAGNTVRVADVAGTGYIWSLGRVGTKVLFSTMRTAANGDLWTTGGTAATTVRIGTDHAAGNGSSMIDYVTTTHGGNAFARWKTGIVFAADDAVHGSELWYSNSQSGVTTMIADINVGPGASDPNGFVLGTDGRLYFQAWTSAFGNALYRLNTDNTVTFCADVLPATSPPEWSALRNLRAVGGGIYLNAINTPEDQSYLIRYDTASGTYANVRDAAGKAIYSGVEPMVNPGTGAIYTVGINSTNSSAPGVLYALNGTLATPLKTLYLGWGGWGKSFASIGAITYFAGDDAVGGEELWQTDGTPAGTKLVKDIYPGSGDSGVGEMVALNGRLYFAASATGGDTTLWTSDGTPGGTLEYAPGVRNPNSFSITGGQLNFIATDGGTVTNFFTIESTSPLTLTKRTNATATLRPVSTFGANFLTFYVMLDRSGPHDRYSLYKFTPFSGTSEFVKDLWVRNFDDPIISGIWGFGRLGFLAANNRLYFPAFRPEWGVEPHSYVLDPIATAINGDVFWDRNGNGAKDAGEPAAANVDVWLDLDDDATLDADEPTARTDGSGAYVFRNLDNGRYVVRPVLTPGVAQTAPAGNAGATLTIPIGSTGPTAGRIGLADTIVPQVLSLVLDRSGSRMSIRAVFSDDLELATLAPADLALEANGTLIRVENTAVSYNAATRTATWTFPGFANGVLPDGRYQATIAAGAVADSFGNGNPTALTSQFTVLSGDADGNGSVDFADLLTLAQNYGLGGKGWAQGNFNYDAAGNVDFDDLLILAQRYGTTLAAAAPPAPAPAARRRGAAAADVIG